MLIAPQPPQPKDPALEHIDAMGSKPFQAFPGQDHRAHMEAHLDFMATNLARNNPMILASLEKNIFEHISLMSQEQAEVEFQQEIQQNPQAMQDPQIQQQLKQFNEKFEARKAVLIADMTGEFLKEEQQITDQMENDPLTKIKERELDLRAQENQRRKDYEEARIQIDRTKAVMNQASDDDRLAQNEKLAKLRAQTSLEKTLLQNTLKKGN